MSTKMHFFRQQNFSKSKKIIQIMFNHTVTEKASFGRHELSFIIVLSVLVLFLLAGFIV